MQIGCRAGQNLDSMQRKNWLLPWGKEKIDIRREAKKKSVIAVRRRKIDYRREAKKKLIIAVRRRKNWYRREAKKKFAVAESSYWTLEHHLRGEQKRKLCLLEQLSMELSEALRDRRCGQKISFWWHHQGHGQTNPA
jgi:hypothetical protein